MTFFRGKYSYKYAVATSIVIGTCGVFYAIKATLNRIEKVINTKVTRSKRCCQYIYINNSWRDDFHKKPQRFFHFMDFFPHIPPKVENISRPDDPNNYGWERFSLMNWWNRKKSLIAWRLLDIAQHSENRNERIKSIKTLVSLKYLQEYDYCHLAQLSDAHCAIALARSKGVDQKFFLKPRISTISAKSKEDLITRWRDLLFALNQTQKHVCVKYFLNKAFPYFLKNWLSMLDLEMTLEGPPPITISEQTIIPMCIQSLEHHASITENAEIMVKFGVLSLLMDTYQFLGSDNNAGLLLIKLIKIIATDQKHLNDLFVTGWIGVLASWVNSADHRLSIPAATILTNMDRDCGSKLGKNLFLLHPYHRQKEQKDFNVDVIVIHGLLGGIHYTWRQRKLCPRTDTLFGMTTSNDDIFMKCALINSSIEEIPLLECDDGEDMEADYEFVLNDIPVAESGYFDLEKEFKLSFNCSEKIIKDVTRKSNSTPCWPKDWLSQDCERTRIIGINYETTLTDWLSWCPLKDKGRKKRIINKSKKLLKQLIESGVGERPIVWISHSMGGILVKHMLVEAWKKRYENLSFYNFSRNTNAIIFLSTPHYGSPLATLNEASKLLFLPSVEVEELSYNSPTLLKLHSEFVNFLDMNPVRVINFIETKCMKITPWELELRCIPRSLKDISDGLVYEIPLGHMDICKPNSRFSFIYQTILQIVRTAALHAQD